PVFLGEFGAYTTQDEPNRNRWIKAVREEMEAADIPWCLWAYANTFPVFDVGQQQWNAQTIEALGLE
ncbi:MAG: glycoside hydrolase family 5 protein, partial [Pseudomonadota bacterium]